MCVWIKRNSIFVYRLLTDTGCVLLNSFPVSPPSSSLTLFSLPSQLQENLGSTWPLTLGLLNTISTVFAGSASKVSLRYERDWWRKKKIVHPFQMFWDESRRGGLFFQVSPHDSGNVVSLSGKNWSLVWSWAGRFCPTGLSQASGTEVKGHQIITIHRVLFWLSSFGKVDFVSDVSSFSDVATAFFLFSSSS